MIIYNIILIRYTIIIQIIHNNILYFKNNVYYLIYNLTLFKLSLYTTYLVIHDWLGIYLFIRGS